MIRFYLSICMILIANSVLAQVSALSPDIKSPNAASLGRFGEIPVTLFTGTPDISIPLIDIKGIALNLPITLRYHPGGIKPNQRSGWVGTGWNVSLGSITREVRGRPDEMDIDATPRTGFYYRKNLVEADWYQYGEAPNLSGDNRIAHHLSLDYTDLEADIFHFNVMGLQGTFFLDQNGKWQVQSNQFVSVELDPAVPLIDPLTKYSFGSANLVSKSFNKFILKDGYGNRYVFGGVNAIEYSSIIEIEKRALLNGSYDDPSSITLQASSWSIVEIESANQVDKIEFTYERGPFVSSLYKHATYNETFKNNGCQSISYSGWVNGGGVTFPVYPKEIKLNNQKVSFHISKSTELNYDLLDDYESMNVSSENFLVRMNDMMVASSTDVPYYSQHQLSNAYYDRIIWMKLDSVSYQVDNARYRTITFGYNNVSSERLFLQTLTQEGSNGDQPYSYAFAYNQKELMPGYLRGITDHWGFDNGVMYAGTPFSPSGIYSLRQPNSSYLMRGILRQITNPAGGKTIFDFELGDYSKIVTKNDRKSLLTESGSGGIRINKIQTYDENGKLALEKRYSYKKDAVKGGTVSSGILNNKPLYYIGTTSGTDMSGGSFSFSSFKSSSVDDLTDHSGILIGYTEVTEISSGGDSSYYRTEIFTNHDNGFTDDNAIYNYHADGLANKPVNSRSFERGLPLRTVYYNALKEKVKSITNTYSIGAPLTNSGRSLMFNYMDVAVNCNMAYYYPSSVSYLNYCHPIDLLKSIDSLFTPVGVSVNIQEFDYSSKYRTLTKTTTYNSAGNSVIHNYKYSYSFGSGISDSYSVYDKMIAKSMLLYPIEEFITKNGSITYAKVNEYKMFGSLLKNSSVFLLETPTPLSSYSNALPSGPDGLLNKDNKVKLNETVLKYDNKGNPLEVVLSDKLNQSLIWGYNRQYPVAKVIGSNFDAVISVVDTALLNNGNTTDDQIRTELNKLRTDSRTRNALVATYTYKQMIGMSSETDPSGKTTYYGYDDFGRLNLIRDQNKNILKQFCYNYAGQPENCKFPYKNDVMSRTFTRDNCSEGKQGGSVTYVVPRGKYSSLISQEDADNQALSDLNNNGHAYANANGTCKPIPVAVTLKNAGGQGGDNFFITFTATGIGTHFGFMNKRLNAGQSFTSNVDWGTYDITIEAKDQSNMKFSLGGVIKTGLEVTYTNVSISAATTIYAGPYQNTTQEVSYTRNNCPTGTSPSSVVYTVPPNIYTSFISQSDANTQAISQLASAGQAYANTNGTCELPPPSTTNIVYTNQLSKTATMKLKNVDTGILYTFSLPKATSPATIGTIPVGTYNVTISINGATNYYSVNSYVQSNPDTDFNVSNIYLGTTTTTVTIY